MAHTGAQAGTVRPLASLSSGLLARKGQAKPAMRPQGFLQLGGGAVTSLDDLGWNDMGPGVSPPAPAPASAALPPVLAERESLRGSVETPPPPARPVSLATAARIGRESAAQTARGKAAFTLRLDAPRHLRLRLASALADRSAQALVTEALDHFLNTMPAVEQLAAQLPAPAARRGR